MNEQDFIQQHAARTASFRRGTFRPLQGETFTYRDASGICYELCLTRIDEGRHGGDVFENFTLVFSSPKSMAFAQGYFLLEHAEHGGFPLFLVPIVTRDTEHNYCCAYFSIRR